MDDDVNNDWEIFVKFDFDGVCFNVVIVMLIFRGDQENIGILFDNFWIEVYGMIDNLWDEIMVIWNNWLEDVIGLFIVYNVIESGFYDFLGFELIDFVKNVISQGNEYVLFVVCGWDNILGFNVWIFDQGWQFVCLFFDYCQIVVVLVIFIFVGGYVFEVIVEIVF